MFINPSTNLEELFVSAYQSEIITPFFDSILWKIFFDV